MKLKNFNIHSRFFILCIYLTCRFIYKVQSFNEAVNVLDDRGTKKYSRCSNFHTQTQNPKTSKAH